MSLHNISLCEALASCLILVHDLTDNRFSASQICQFSQELRRKNDHTLLLHAGISKKAYEHGLYDDFLLALTPGNSTPELEADIGLIRTV